MPEIMTWEQAIIKTLEQSSEPMQSADIADYIAANGFYKSLGATPASTVGSIISSSLKHRTTASPFRRVARGFYWLANRSDPNSEYAQDLEPDDTTTEPGGLIQAFGMYWAREDVAWKNRTPKIYGYQPPGEEGINFSGQHGVYLLHDGRIVVYVGRTTEQDLGTRLQQHTVDRLKGRWDRFSWFGIYGVNEDGGLQKNKNPEMGQEASMLISTMEALLIEGLEPPQNRKRGDDFRAIEFLQFEDPEITRNNIIMVLDKLKEKL